MAEEEGVVDANAVDPAGSDGDDDDDEDGGARTTGNLARAEGREHLILMSRALLMCLTSRAGRVREAAAELLAEADIPGALDALQVKEGIRGEKKRGGGRWGKREGGKGRGRGGEGKGIGTHSRYHRHPFRYSCFAQLFFSAAATVACGFVRLILGPLFAISATRAVYGVGSNLAGQVGLGNGNGDPTRPDQTRPDP